MYTFVCLLSISTIILRSIHNVACIIQFFLLPSSILLYEQRKVCLSFHLLVGIWVVTSFCMNIYFNFS